MIYDNRMSFSAAQTVAGTAGTGINSTNVYDSGAATRDLGNGDDLWLLVEVVTDIVTGGSAGTLLIQLVSSAAAALTTPTIHASISLVTGAAASVAAGTKAGSQAWCIPFPTTGPTYLEYIGLIITPTTTTTTGGSINAFTSLDNHGLNSYPQASSII